MRFALLRGPVSFRTPAIGQEGLVDHHLDSHDWLFLSVEARLKRLALRCHLPPCECEDCVQEAWLALLEAHPDWALDEQRTTSWLQRVVHNKAADFHRGRNEVVVSQLDEMSQFRAFDPASIPRGADPDSHDSPKLQDCLKQLGAVNREILLLRVQCGMTYPEIGSVVGLRPEVVKWRYHRSLRKMARAMLPSTHKCIDGRVMGRGGGRRSHSRRIPLTPGFLA
jgi:RNA polymerase sigma-70 factor, ECF subfamily